MVIKRVTTVVAPKRAALATVEARATRPAINDSGVATIDETTIAMIDANKYIPSTRQKLPRVSSQPRLNAAHTVWRSKTTTCGTNNSRVVRYTVAATATSKSGKKRAMKAPSEAPEISTTTPKSATNGVMAISEDNKDAPISAPLRP